MSDTATPDITAPAADTAATAPVALEGLSVQPAAPVLDVAPASGSTSTEPAPPLSKKAQKRLAKAAYLAERKKERRAVEKERRKEKKRALAEKRAAGELDPEEEEAEQQRKRQKMERGPRTPFGARVVVDLGFDEMMTENEVKSLTSQLAYTYSANKKAEHPFSSLLFTSLNGRTFERMEATNHAAYKRWVGAEWWTEGYERLWEQADEPTIENIEARGDGEAESERASKRRKKHQPSRAARESVVYLTADTEDELTELKEGETYIIGGIVDHNRYKNLCFNKSKEHNIRSARLPIGTYLSELRTRKVLTVNQTFDILVKWVETRDWKEALYSVIPKRKFNTTGRRRGGGSSSKSGESGDEDEEAAEAEAGGEEFGSGDECVEVVEVAVPDDATHVETLPDTQSAKSKPMEVEDSGGK
ncbi:guanine-1-methyltransferase-domain-containing protein [Lenzites betulinus]|nr:guanine-1-methyltransferase-domain-containing protein [Lenzites betulinus]